MEWLVAEDGHYVPFEQEAKLSDLDGLVALSHDLRESARASRALAVDVRKRSRELALDAIVMRHRARAAMTWNRPCTEVH